MGQQDAMQTKTKVLSISTLVSAALLLFLTLSAAQANVERTQAPNGATTMKIKVNGRFAETFLIDTDNFTNESLNASKDQITNTSALDFAYAIVDPTNPEQLILIQGAGAIPNSAFTITSTTAHLGPVTVSNSDSFLIVRCVINLVAGTFECAHTTGPVTTKFKGGFTSLTADFNRTWDGHTPDNFPGATLRDSHSTTIIREITVEPNP
jgi:hypothetical protein